MGVLRLDFAFDVDAELGKRTDGIEDVSDVAESILMGRELRIGRNVDAPARHVLPFVVARRQPQQLDHPRCRWTVAINGTMADVDVHVQALFVIRASLFSPFAFGVRDEAAVALVELRELRDAAHRPRASALYSRPAYAGI